MDVDWLAVATALVMIGGSIISVFSALDTRRSERERKASAAKDEAAATRDESLASNSAAQSVNILLDPLNKRLIQLEREYEELGVRHAAELEVLRAKVAAQQAEIDELKGGVAVLVAQLDAAGLTPRYKPKPKTGPAGE